jgi:DNA-directed RNA polymerase specialized sigma24 family protein
MPLVRGQAKDRFEDFAADAMDTLFRTGCLLTGDAGDAEDLVQETFLRVAKRWNRVESMDHPVAYARRILVNLVLDGAERRTRQRAEPAKPAAWGRGGTGPPTCTCRCPPTAARCAISWSAPRACPIPRSLRLWPAGCHPEPQQSIARNRTAQF